jgi:hypothetical protein
MAKIVRQDPPHHLVIPDTNILWCKDKGPAVNPDFDKWWDQQSGIAPMELVLPHVVRGELLYQQTTSALKAHEKITEHCVEIASITTSPHRNKISQDRIRKQIATKLDKWITNKSARVAPIPVGSVDIAAIAEQAIWRIPPFEADSKNPDHEKGFRDALILETMADIVAKEKKALNFVFLSGDHLLRTAVAHRLRTDARAMCYESLQDFSSYLKLTREKLTNEFIKGIIPRAASKFFTSGDDSCIVLRDKLLDRLRNEYKSKLQNPTESEASVISSLLSLSAGTGKWKSTNDGGFFLAGTEFLKLEGEREYHWKSGLTFIRFFSNSTDEIEEFLGTAVSIERILILPFKVSWKSNVKADARFHDTSIVNITLEGNVFREPTEQEIAKYHPRKKANS